MIPMILGGVAAIGMAGIIGFGVTRVFRRRKITMSDLPELPAPPEEKSGPGPTLG